MKKTILADFDGVLHEYIKPWQGADVIPDGPVPAKTVPSVPSTSACT